jgi:hypothetical protein
LLQLRFGPLAFFDNIAVSGASVIADVGGEVQAER